MNSRRWLALLFCFAILLGGVGCPKKNKDKPQSSSADTKNTSSSEAKKQTTGNEPGDSKKGSKPDAKKVDDPRPAN